MQYQRFLAPFVTVALLVPIPAAAFYHKLDVPGRSGSAPGRQRAVIVIEDPSPSPTVEALGLPSPSPTPRGKLRRPEHASRLVRVQGIATGMTNKLTNLSSQLNQHLANVERRVAALRAAGHEITVDAELAAVRAAVQEAQTMITGLIAELSVLGDSETPRQAARAVRQNIRELRVQLRAVRLAFQALRLAIRADVRATRPSSSPSPSAVLTPSPTPTPPVIPPTSPEPLPAFSL